MFRTIAEASSTIFKLERLRGQKNIEKVMPKHLNNLQINVFQVLHYYHRKEH